MENNQQNTSASSCMCAELSDLVVIDMGDESEKVFRTFEQKRKRGSPWWWLAVYRCHQCQQLWLLGQESRINDVYCLYKLEDAVMEDVLNNNRWPTIFEHYEDLLRIGFEAGKRVRFLEPLKSKSLRWIMVDLATDRPGIRIDEIAVLLNLDLELADEIAMKVVEEDGVNISFDRVE